MSDKDAIRELLARYCFALDADRFEEMIHRADVGALGVEAGIRLGRAGTRREGSASNGCDAA
jgi:hypothetical protein